MQDKKEYFACLERELEDLPMKDRLLQELTDHVEDMEEDSARNGRTSLTLEKMKQKIGDSKYIKTTCYSILNPLRALYFISEGLFYGLLLFPFGMASMFSFGRICVLFGDRLSMNRIDIFLTFAAVGLFCILWFVGYSFAFGHYKILKKTTGYSLLTWIILIMFPSSVIWIGLLSTLLGEVFTCPSCVEAPLMDILSIMTAMFVIVLSLGAMGLLALKTSKVHLKSRINVGQKGSIFLAIYLIAYGILRTGNSYGLFEYLPFDSSIFSFVFFPIFLVA